jgi:hypothetical protein
MSSAPVLNGSIVAMLAITLMFEDDEQQAIGAEAEMASVSGGNDKAPRGKVEK